MIATALLTIILIAILALVVYGEQHLSPPLDAGLVRILQAITIIGGALIIAQRVGVL